MLSRRAQSMIDYVIIIGLVAATVGAMIGKFKWRTNWRLEQVKGEQAPRHSGVGSWGTK
jgi:hypothetical protein